MLCSFPGVIRGRIGANKLTFLFHVPIILVSKTFPKVFETRMKRVCTEVDPLSHPYLPLFSPGSLRVSLILHLEV